MSRLEPVLCELYTNILQGNYNRAWDGCQKFEKGLWGDFGEKDTQRNVNMSPLYWQLYLSVCILLGDKYIFTITNFMRYVVQSSWLECCR